MEASVVDNSDGSYSVSYTPKEPGAYSVWVCVKAQHVKVRRPLTGFIWKCLLSSFVVSAAENFMFKWLKVTMRRGVACSSQRTASGLSTSSWQIQSTRTKFSSGRNKLNRPPLTALMSNVYPLGCLISERRVIPILWFNVELCQRRLTDSTCLSLQGSPFVLNVKRKLRRHTGTFHCCSFCSSGGDKEARCGCPGTMPGTHKT